MSKIKENYKKPEGLTDDITINECKTDSRLQDIGILVI